MTTEQRRGNHSTLLDALRRERQQTAARLGAIHGLMPLLMKRRNGQRWSKQDRAQLVGQLRALADVSPYLIVMILPGSVLLLPLLAWWLDRRRMARASGAESSPP